MTIKTRWASRIGGAIVTATALAVGLTACSSATGQEAETGAEASGARTVEQIQDSGTIQIGVFSDKAPFGSVDADGDYVGYDIVYAERIGEDLGVEIEYLSVDPAARVEFLESGKVDIILANFTVTEERAEKVDFANPYFKVDLGVVSPDSALITDVSELEDKTLIIVKGTTAEAFFEANHPEITLEKYDQYNEAYSALQDGRGDAFSTDNTEVLAWALNNPGFTTGITTLGQTDYIAAAVQKGNEDLLTWLNDQLVELGQEDFFHNAYQETLEPVYGDAADPDDLVVEGGQP